MPPITLGMEVAKQLMSLPSRAGKIPEQELKAAYEGRRLRLNGARIRQITDGRKVRYIYELEAKSATESLKPKEEMPYKWATPAVRRREKAVNRATILALMKMLITLMVRGEATLGE
jgi:hypothetical protein